MAYGTVNVGQAQTDDSKYLTTEQVGTPSGLATLDANGKLTASQRPTLMLTRGNRPTISSIRMWRRTTRTKPHMATSALPSRLLTRPSRLSS